MKVTNFELVSFDNALLSTRCCLIYVLFFLINYMLRVSYISLPCIVISSGTVIEHYEYQTGVDAERRTMNRWRTVVPQHPT